MTEFGFSSMGEYGRENHIGYVKVVSRDRGLTVYSEKGFSDHIHESKKIDQPLYCVGLTMNENHESVSGKIKQNISISECGPLVIVPRKFSRYFYDLEKIADKYSSSSFFHVFETFNRKIKANHKEDELRQWWDQVVQLYDFDPDFSAEDVPFTSKNFEGWVAAAKVKWAQQEKEIEKFILEQQREKKAFDARQQKIKLAEEKKKSVISAQKTIATVPKTSTIVEKKIVKHTGFKVLDEKMNETDVSNLEVLGGGNGVSLLKTKPPVAVGGNAYSKYIIDFIDRTANSVENQKQAKKYEILTNVVIFPSVIGGVMASLLISAGLTSILGDVWAGALFSFLVIATIFATIHYGGKVDQKKCDAEQNAVIDPTEVKHPITVPERFAKKLEQFFSNDDYSFDYSSIMAVLKDKVDSQQNNVEIESWLSIVDEISEIDSSFPLDRIPAMSEDAAVVCDAIKHKKISDTETETAIEQTRNEVLVDFMRQDSVAARTGAMSLLGIVEDGNKNA